MIQILFAVVAGILTVGAPCILPMLPIILGTSVGQHGKLRPLFITIGFVISFAVVAFVFGAFTKVLGLSQNALRDVSVVLLTVFGIFLVWPTPFEKLTEYLSAFITTVTAATKWAGSGNVGGLVLGAALGVIWTPCAGPVLGSILTLIATKQNSGQAAALLFAYAIGAGIPMLLIAYGGQYVTTRVRGIAKYSRIIQQIFGVVIILLAFAIYKGYDVRITNALTADFPSTAGIEQKLTDQPTTSAVLSDYGPAPDFTGATNWLNGPPQTIAGLKGKVVLVDFWTYSCINCIRTLPYVTKWYDTYQANGLVVIGVHTPEFSFEKDPANVQSAIQQFGIHYPVAQDNNYAIWDAYHNEYWPAEYLIDQNGNIVEESFGEGDYATTENNIRQLLGLSPLAAGQDVAPDLSGIGSPEMYFGTDRQQYLDSSQQPQVSASAANYTLPASLALNTFAVGGSWEFDPSYAQLDGSSGKIDLHFHSSNAYMVASSDKPVNVTVIVDGKQYKTLTIQASQLYTLYQSDSSADHTLELDISGPGLQAFTFTFG